MAKKKETKIEKTCTTVNEVVVHLTRDDMEEALAQYALKRAGIDRLPSDYLSVDIGDESDYYVSEATVSWSHKDTVDV